MLDDNGMVIIATSNPAECWNSFSYILHYFHTLDAILIYYSATGYNQMRDVIIDKLCYALFRTMELIIFYVILHVLNVILHVLTSPLPDEVEMQMVHYSCIFIRLIPKILIRLKTIDIGSVKTLCRIHFNLG